MEETRKHNKRGGGRAQDWRQTLREKVHEQQ